jgi:hypothetical protein
MTIRLAAIAWTVPGVLLFFPAGLAQLPEAVPLDVLISQLQGDGCRYTTRPTSTAPDQTCKPLPGGFFERLFTTRRECIQSAALCLLSMGRAATPAVPALIEAIRTGPNNYDTGDGVILVRDSIVEALGATGDPRALPVLLDILDHPRPMDAGLGAVPPRDAIGELAALRALARMGPTAAPAVARVLPFLARDGDGPEDSQLPAAAASALAAIGDPVAIPALTAALARPAAVPRVAEALGRFGPAAAEALPALTRLIEQSPDRNGHYVIRRAIASIGGRPAASRLPKSYDLMMNSLWDSVRAAARQAGVRLRGVHLNGPKELIETTLPGGETLVITFSKDAWFKRKIVTGTVTMGPGGGPLRRQPYTGIQQLQSLVTASVTPSAVR